MSTQQADSETVLERFLDDSEVLDALKYWGERRLKGGNANRAADDLLDRLAINLDYHARQLAECDDDSDRLYDRQREGE